MFDQKNLTVEIVGLLLLIASLFSDRFNVTLDSSLE
jgi:hypothetical protein